MDWYLLIIYQQLVIELPKWHTHEIWILFIMIKDTVETAYNPFGIGTSFLGIDSRTSIGGKNARKKKERQKHLWKHPLEPESNTNPAKFNPSATVVPFTKLETKQKKK